MLAERLFFREGVMYENSNLIIKDARVLEEDFIPKEVVHRNSEVQEMERSLKPIIKGEKGRNMLLYGPTGTGKTCLSNYVIEELSSHTSTLGSAYVNCWKNHSNFKVLYEIVSELGTPLNLHRKGMGTQELLEKLNDIQRKRHSVVILDEVDQLENDKLLYEFSQVPNLTIIFIANKSTIFYDADPRVRSRLQDTNEIKFSEYSQEEITDILKDRAEWGLLPDVINKQKLRMISNSASGDARKAITALRVAANLAENQDEEEIKEEYIKEALPKAREKAKKRSLSSLNKHQRVLYEIIEEEGEVKSSRLYKKYEKEVQEGVVKRTLRNYLNKMVDYNLIEAEGKGRWRSYSLAE